MSVGGSCEDPALWRMWGMLHRAKALCNDYILEFLPLTHASALYAVLSAEDQRKARASLLRVAGSLCFL